MPENVWTLVAIVSIMGLALGAIMFLSQHYTLDGIKAKTVGDGQHGTARWATRGEIIKTFRNVPFRPALWRKGEALPKAHQGLVLGSVGKPNEVTALVDCDDIHGLMIGASVIGKINGKGHAWNKVMLDGAWYNADVCWDDDGIDHSYLLKSDAWFERHAHDFTDKLSTAVFASPTDYEVRGREAG